jgi:hypothetical protein
LYDQIIQIIIGDIRNRLLKKYPEVCFFDDIFEILLVCKESRFSNNIRKQINEKEIYDYLVKEINQGRQPIPGIIMSNEGDLFIETWKLYG